METNGCVYVLCCDFKRVLLCSLSLLDGGGGIMFSFFSFFGEGGGYPSMQGWLCLLRGVNKGEFTLKVCEFRYGNKRVRFMFFIFCVFKSALLCLNFFHGGGGG